MCGDCRWVFSDPLFFLSLFTSLIHPASFYFRTDESSELHLKLICLLSLIPDPGFLCLCSYLSTHAHCLTHTSPLSRIRDLSKSVHTLQDRLQHLRCAGGRLAITDATYTIDLHTKKRGYVLHVYHMTHTQTHQTIWTFTITILVVIVPSWIRFHRRLLCLPYGSSLLQLLPITDRHSLVRYCWDLFLYGPAMGSKSFFYFILWLSVCHSGK